jgi:hypothetical protein
VLRRGRGAEYLHLLKAISRERFQIGNNRGGINGWIGANAIFGKCIRVEPSTNSKTALLPDGPQHNRNTTKLAERHADCILYSLQATAKAFMQSVSYSVRSACIGSMEAARRAGIIVAIKPEIASNAQTDKIVVGSCRPTPKRNA